MKWLRTVTDGAFCHSTRLTTVTRDQLLKRLAQVRQVAPRLKAAAQSHLGEQYRRLRRHRDYRFLIFACPRTGSSSLAHLLNAYLGIRCALEPFNPDWNGEYWHRVADAASLEREMGKLWRRYNGVKHVWEPDGFPFVGHPEFNDYLLTASADRVVVLNRKNILRRIVSWHIGHQAGVFHVWDEADRAKLIRHRFAPLDKAAIKEQLVRAHRATAAVTRRLDDVRLPYKILWYEDVFRAESPERTLCVVSELISFVTGRPFQLRRLQAGALTFLDPANVRMNSNSALTYELVPNIREIEDELGSAETGYLFG